MFDVGTRVTINGNAESLTYGNGGFTWREEANNTDDIYAIEVVQNQVMQVTGDLDLTGKTLEMEGGTVDFS